MGATMRRLACLFIAFVALVATLSLAQPAQASVAPAPTTSAALAMCGPPCVQLGSPTFTGRYHAVVSGPHITYVPVYIRSVHACYSYSSGVVIDCMSGSIVYAAGYAACFNGCTVAGLRGSQYCGVSPSGTFPGFSSTVVACRNHLMQTGPAAGYGSVAYEDDRICDYVPIITSCVTRAYHLNAYGSGNVTIYGGEGIA